MKIEDSKINFTSFHSLEKKFVEKKRSQIWIGENPENNERGSIEDSFKNAFKKIKDMVNVAKAQLMSSVTDIENIDPETEIPPMERMKADLISLMLEKLTGKKFKIFVLDPDELNKGADIQSTGENGAKIPVQGNDEGWGAEIELYRSFKEEEMMSFNAAGVVKTKDGKEIQLDMELNFHRAFFQEEYLNVKLGNALKDPLVVNFSGDSLELSQDKFSFDIDVDGVEDMISHISSGAGFLALDKNGNGKIDDGSELFGAESGNGFEDLSKYDTDSNGWIDENDEIFSSLRIWEKYSDGTDRLVAIKEKDIGAIYLGNIDSEYAFSNGDNSKNGYLRKTGIFLKESGGAGFVHHIDMQI